MPLGARHVPGTKGPFGPRSFGPIIPPAAPTVATTPVSNSVGFAVEATGAVVLTLDLPIEARGAVALTLADPVEAAGGAARTSSLPVEALGGVVQTSSRLGPLPVAAGYAGAGADDSIGGVPWTNPGNVVGPPDGLLATVTLSSGGFSDNLYASTYGFAIDPTLPVLGIEVVLRGLKAPVAVDPANDFLIDVVVMDAGHPGSGIGGQSFAVSGGPTDVTVGGPTDRWNNQTLGASVVNGPLFGVKINLSDSSAPPLLSHDFSIDAIQVTVYQPGGAVNIESLGAAASARSGPVEAAGAAAQPLSFPIEATQAAATSSSDPLESAGGVSTTASAPVEATGGIAALAASVLEALQGLAQSALAAVESALGLSTSASDPVESAQGVAATGSDPVESAGAVAASAADPLESLGGVASTTSAPIESLQTGTTPVSQTGTLAIEATLGVLAEASLQVEAAGGVSTAPDLPLETVQPLSQTATAPAEALLAVAGPTAALPLDVLGSLLATGTLPTEALGFLPIPPADEGVGGIIGDIGGPSHSRKLTGRGRRLDDDEELVRVLDLLDLL